MLTIRRSMWLCVAILATGSLPILAEPILAEDQAVITTDTALEWTCSVSTKGGASIDTGAASADEAAPDDSTGSPQAGLGSGGPEMFDGQEALDTSTLFDYGTVKMTVTYAESAVRVTWLWPNATVAAVTSYVMTSTTSARVHTDFGSYGEYEYDVERVNDTFTTHVLLDTLDRRGLALTPVHDTVVRVAAIGSAAASRSRWDLTGLQSGPVLASALAEAAFLPLWNDEDPQEGGSLAPQIACRYRTNNRTSCMECCDNQYNENTTIWCKILASGVTAAVVLGSEGAAAPASPYIAMVTNSICTRAAYRGMRICKKECNDTYPSVASDNESGN